MGAHQREICPAALRTTEISAAAQTACSAYPLRSALSRQRPGLQADSRPRVTGARAHHRTPATSISGCAVWPPPAFADHDACYMNPLMVNCGGTRQNDVLASSPELRLYGLTPKRQHRPHVEVRAPLAPTGRCGNRHALPPRCHGSHAARLMRG